MARPRVMIVDDDPVLCQNLCAALDECGLDASCHTDATSAIVEMSGQGTAPDVLVLDVHMPDVSGLGVLHIMSEKKLHIPTLLISGLELSDDPSIKNRFGYSDQLEKPFGLHVFVRRVRALLPASKRENPAAA